MQQQKEILGAVLQNRRLVAELCCSPTSKMTAVACQQLGEGGGIRIGLPAFDLFRKDAQQRALALLRAHRPAYVWVAPPCTAWTSWQHYNQYRPGVAEELQLERERSARLMRTVFSLALTCQQEWGAHVCFEHPRHATSWRLKQVRRFLQLAGTYTAELDGCSVGLRSGAGLVLKP